MPRVLVVALALLLGNAGHAADYAIDGVIDLQLPFANGTTGWLYEGLGKLSYDESDDATPHLALAGVDLGVDFNTKHGLRGTVVYNDDPRGGVQVSELYYRYRPLSLSSRRYQVKVGVFFPALSLENVGIAWTSPYSVTTSVMNSWIQEEIRATGIQLTTTWLGRYRNSSADLSLTAGLLWNNDTAGAMLSWRGWAGHHRIPGWGESLPAAPIPFIVARPQVQKYEPFEELDDRPGGYVLFNVRGEKWRLLAAWYHNGAKTDLLIDGQYTWRTRFIDLGVSWQGDNGWELLGQWMQGDTKMESIFFTNVVVNDYDSQYLAAVKTWDRHRALVRLERFRVEDLDSYPGDDNEERGSRFTALYAYNLSDAWEFTVQGSQVDSTRDARMYFGMDPRQVEKLLILGARYYF